MEKEYLTVKEFAEKANITKQAAYQQIKGRLKPFIKVEQGKTLIESSALSKFYNEQEIRENSSDKSTCSRFSSQVEQAGKSAVDEKLLELLQQQLELNKQQLEMKDKQIEELNSRLAEALKTVDQQQQLAVLDKKKILELEEKAQEQEEQQAADDKKGFWSKLWNK